MKLSSLCPDSKLYVSVVIPVYNQSQQIGKCLDTLLSPYEDSIEKELLLINDGSSDNSEDVCLEYASVHSNIKYLYQVNKGVSAARNLGLKYATGKYIFFLDADDELESGTIEKVTNFYETVWEEVDLVTYPIDTVFEGRILPPHFRYQYLRESGVYNLKKFPYIGQTTMNIAVRNYYKDNILFDDKQTFSEDQKYCCEILKRNLKMGYCNQGKYIYNRSSSSSSAKLSGACYIFEQCTSLFEGIFTYFTDEEVPLAFQGLFINDFCWKLMSNILFPYHYSNEEFQLAITRLQKLLSRCDNETILNHPQIDFFEKYYLLRMKGNSGITCKTDVNGFGLFKDQKCYVYEESMEVVITKLFVKGKSVRLQGFLKSVFFQFYDDIPSICAVQNQERFTVMLPVRPSSHNYYLTHESTQHFFTFDYECNIFDTECLHFEVGLNNRWYPTHYYFMPYIPFSHNLQRYTYINNGIELRIDSDNCIHFKEVPNKKRKLIWLYYDCFGVGMDNGMKQFLHDYQIKDGIKRFYVITDDRQRKNLPKPRYGIQFGSKLHQKIFLCSDKILTAYIEEANFIPFQKSDYEKYSKYFHFEVIYLQHGVLHIQMPWKYSAERLLANKVVVSTRQEAELYLNSGFHDKDLIKSRMPRFYHKDTLKKGKRKILFAPSWRSYLVGKYIDREWALQDSRFITSSYYRKISDFLNSKELHSLLVQNDYILDVKFHPIFIKYSKHFNLQSDRIHLVNDVVTSDDYSLFITDFSSLMFDYLYQSIPVLFFLPDKEEFRSGMNGYYDFYDSHFYWKNVLSEPRDIVMKLNAWLQNEAVDNLKVDFLECENPCECIYNEVMSTYEDL